jgi:hypothetical protein
MYARQGRKAARTEVHGCGRRRKKRARARVKEALSAVCCKIQINTIEALEKMLQARTCLFARLAPPPRVPPLWSAENILIFRFWLFAVQCGTYDALGHPTSVLDAACKRFRLVLGIYGFGCGSEDERAQEVDMPFRCLRRPFEGQR